MLSGYKTYVGAALLGLGAALEALGFSEFGLIARQLGEAIAVVGVGHKIQKLLK